MANLPLAFAELLAGGLLLTAGLTGDPIEDIIAGEIKVKPFSGADAVSSGTSSSTSTGSTGAVSGSGGYVNPLAKAKNVTPERTDMGKDYSMSPGSPILAIGDAIVAGITRDWYAGQSYMALKLTSGPNAGQTYYLAEQINPTVQVGQKVQAGQTIATYASSGTGIETGWADPNNWAQTLAQGTTGYVEGEATKAGQEFTAFLQSLGAPV